MKLNLSVNIVIKNDNNINNTSIDTEKENKIVDVLTALKMAEEQLIKLVNQYATDIDNIKDLTFGDCLNK